MEIEVKMRMDFEEKLNNVHTQNRDLKAERDMYFCYYEKIQGKNKEIDDELSKLQGETNILSVYKAETAEKLDQMKQELKKVERELDVNKNQYRIYEEKYIMVQKEFSAAQSIITEYDEKIKFQKVSLKSKDDAILSYDKKIKDLNAKMKEVEQLLDLYKTRYEENIQKLNAALEEKQAFETQCAGHDEVEKEMQSRIDFYKAKTQTLTTENEECRSQIKDLEIKHQNMLDMYESSKIEYDNTYTQLKNVNQSRSDFELLAEHRLKIIKGLEREVDMKENKILEFRERYEIATQNLMNKEEIYNDLRLQKEKVEAEFQKFKELMIKQGYFLAKNDDDIVKNIAENKKKWQKKREEEEKSFVDANQYLQV